MNLCRDRVRWLRRRPRESALADGADLPGATDELAERVGQRCCVIQALAELPAGQRQVVVLRFLADLSVAETAQVLGISTGTVKSYTSRALSALRVALDDTAAGTTAHRRYPMLTEDQLADQLRDPAEPRGSGDRTPP